MRTLSCSELRQTNGKGRNRTFYSPRLQDDECVEVPALWQMPEKLVFRGAVLVRVAYALQLLCPKQ